MEQYKLHRTLNRMRKQCPHWFDVDCLVMTQDLYEQMSVMAQSLMSALNFFKPGGIQDASEYLTLEGHLQMWCDSNGWEWYFDNERDVFRFGKLVGEKELCGRDVRLRCFVDGDAMKLIVQEFIREPRPKERCIEEVPA